MKAKKVVMAFMLILAIVINYSSNAEDKKDSIHSKNVSLDKSFDKVYIDKDISVIFTTKVQSATIIGTSEFLNNTIIKIENGLLTIKTISKGRTGRGYINLPMSVLKEIRLNTDASVTSEGFLNCPNLTIYLNEGSHANLKNRGHLQIVSCEECEPNYEKYQVILEN